MHFNPGDAGGEVHLCITKSTPTVKIIRSNGGERIKDRPAKAQKKKKERDHELFLTIKLGLCHPEGERTHLACE